VSKHATCTECGEPCVTNSVKRRDAANVKHDFHVDCLALMAWWLDGHHDKPSETDPAWVAYREKFRRALRDEAAVYGTTVTP
jgi:hypothetical protein